MVSWPLKRILCEALKKAEIIEINCSLFIAQTYNNNTLTLTSHAIEPATTHDHFWLPCANSIALKLLHHYQATNAPKSQASHDWHCRGGSVSLKAGKHWKIETQKKLGAFIVRKQVVDARERKTFLFFILNRKNPQAIIMQRKTICRRKTMKWVERL